MTTRQSQDDVEAAYRASLARGHLSFQRCACTEAWLPPREQCPRCLRADFRWEEASGGARLISWVVYHRAYDDAFADRLPYCVAVVELDEGPRLVTNVVGAADPEALQIEQPLQLRIELERGIPVPRFAQQDFPESAAS
jgi:uncharacterized OB-fold protein